MTIVSCPTFALDIFVRGRLNFSTGLAKRDRAGVKGYGLCMVSLLGVTHYGATAQQKIILISVHLRKVVQSGANSRPTPFSFSQYCETWNTGKREGEQTERKSKAVWKVDKNVWKRKRGAVGQRRDRGKK